MKSTNVLLYTFHDCRVKYNELSWIKLIKLNEHRSHDPTKSVSDRWGEGGGYIVNRPYIGVQKVTL